MFEDEVRSKRILRIVIGINIIFLLLLVFYVFHIISLEILYGEVGIFAYPWWKLLWTIIFVLVITLITVQLTLDVDMMLFKDEFGERKVQDRVEVWIKVSSIFLVISSLGFSLSLFAPGRESPWIILILGFGGLIFRVFLLSIAFKFLTYLKTGSLPRHSFTV